MDTDDLENRLTAWWLQLAPSRQEELLSPDPPPMPWLEASLDQAGLDQTDVDRFLHDRRTHPEATPDAGLHPRPT